MQNVLMKALLLAFDFLPDNRHQNNNVVENKQFLAVLDVDNCPHGNDDVDIACTSTGNLRPNCKDFRTNATRACPKLW